MEYLTTKEVSRTYGVSRLTVYNWIKRGTIKAIKVGGVLRVVKTSLPKEEA